MTAASIRRARKPRARLVAVPALFALIGAAAWGDWPTYMADAARSGVSPEPLAFPLAPTWVHRSAPPTPAWPPPAREDVWHQIPRLQPENTFDRAAQPVVVGKALYLASSAEGVVRSLDLDTGRERWAALAEGPVRLAPSVAGERVYFGSDDGFLYCASTEDGAVLWRRRVAPTDRVLPGNGRLISASPLRSGVLVLDGLAYYAAGLFPNEGVVAGALDASTGEPLWTTALETCAQGYLVASPTRLYVPTGRTEPVVLDRATGVVQGSVAGPGGAWALLSGDVLLSGPGRGGGAVQASDAGSRDTIASFDGTRMAALGNVCYIQSASGIVAIDRSRLAEGAEAELWRSSVECPYALILAGDTLIAGGRDCVRALAAEDGTEVWSAEVDGDAYGLCVSAGRLVASTSTGATYCFAPQAARRPAETPGAPEAAGPALVGAARAVLDVAGVAQGYALILSPASLELVRGLVEASEMHVVIAEPDEAAAAAFREELYGEGLLGTRVSVHHCPQERLPYTSWFANLVFSEETPLPGRLPWSLPEVSRVVRPYGGVIVLGVDSAKDALNLRQARLARAESPEWRIESSPGGVKTLRRGAPSGAGAWTTLYADSGNTSCSHDAVAAPFSIQWFGEPGPREMVDRHHRPMSSLFAEGRLFIPGEGRVIAADAYNGVTLWTVEIPGPPRVGAPRSNGHMITDGAGVFVAHNDACWRLDARTGDRLAEYRAPRPSDEEVEWGYVQRHKDLLLGSTQQPGGAVTGRGIDVVNQLYRDDDPLTLSESLFALDAATGDQRWLHRPEGVVLNTTLAVCRERDALVFVERRGAPGPIAGRMTVGEFCSAETHLVALDLTSGRPLLDAPIALPYSQSCYLSVEGDRALACGSYNNGDQVEYVLIAYDLADGAERWRYAYQPGYAIGGGHGEQDQHPVIVGNRVYSRPIGIDLRTGEPLGYRFERGGHGCGGVTGSEHYLYGRGWNPRAYPLLASQTDGLCLTRVTRPGCWLNIIPAGGLVLIPESSSGCTCGFAVQTSLALIPESRL